MGHQCKTCQHPKVHEIDKLIVEGVPNTTIAKKYGLNFQSVRSHGMHHLPKKLIRAAEAKELKHGEDILDGIHDLLQRTKKILDKAEAKGNARTALQAVGELRNTYELISRIAVKMAEYRKEEKESDKGDIEKAVSIGLHTLTNTELEVYVQLLAKIASADPDYQFTPKVQSFLDGVSRIFVPETGYEYENILDRIPTSSRRMRRTRKQAHNNTQKADSVLGLGLTDLDLEDLELSDTKAIPNEESDPDWLKQWRKEHPESL